MTQQEINEIKQLAVQFPEEAKNVCQSRFEGDVRDECLFEAALESNNAGLCEAIADVNRRDTCLFNIIFVTQDYDLCDKIQKQLEKDTCNSLR